MQTDPTKISLGQKYLTTSNLNGPNYYNPSQHRDLKKLTGPTVQFLIAFYSLFGDFSGKGEVFQKWFSPWTITSKRFHPKIPTRSKVVAVLKWGTSGAIYFLLPWFLRVFIILQLKSPEKGVGKKN